MSEDEDIMVKVLAGEIDNRIQLEKRVRWLEYSLKQINEIAKDLHEHLKSQFEDYYDPYKDGSARVKVDKIKEHSNV